MRSQRKRAPAENQPKAESRRFLIFALHLLMFVSGALALVYEILWMRRFTAVFGATTPAVAATLAAVFLGFTVGSLVIGTRAVRWSRPLCAYGFLEVGAGLGALLVEPLLKCYEHFYPSLYQTLAGSPSGFVAVKTVLVTVALLIPTFCMGGTVPLLVQTLAAERRRLGVSGGGLYSANTLGAAVGAVSVPFVWLPCFSARTSYAVCVAGSVLIGAIAFWLDRGAPQSLLAIVFRKPAARTSRTLSVRALTLLAALSGLLLFILQVVWSRMFAQVHENSIYSFAVVVAVLLVGLAGGASLARQCLLLGVAPDRLLGIAWIAGGAAVFVTPHLFHTLTDGLSYLRGTSGWASFGLRLLWLTLPTVLLPTLLAGMALPLLMEMAGQASDQPSGQLLGWLLGANTMGAICGSLVAAFLFPALFGLWGSLVFVAIAMILAGESCLATAASRRLLAPRRLILGGLIVGVLFLWNPASLPRTRLRADQGEKLLALKESGHGIVAVVEKDGSRRIKLNNFYVLGGTASTGDERQQGHLPLLLHPAPKRVAFLGLGTGITAGAALLHPVEHVTAIEIVPDVIEAARNHFADANLRIVDSPRVEVIAEDARNYLNGSAGKFDVIVGDLVVPWRQGEASLYTGEQFAAARRSLATGGIFCQWLPLFQLSETEFDIVVATFLDVFPRTTLWRGDFSPNAPAVALVGQLDGTPIDPGAVERRLHELKADEANPSLVHPAGLWIFLVGPLDAGEKRFARARRNRENEPWLEILGPLNHTGTDARTRSLFIGWRLEEFLAQTRQKSLANSPLERLGALPTRWREAGAQIGIASLLMLEGRRTETEAALRTAAAGLPTEVQNAILGSLDH